MIVARYAQRRAALKEILRLPLFTAQQRQLAGRAVRKLPRDTSPTRLRNRDAIDGRPRGYLRTFGLSRIRVREMAHRGELPGYQSNGSTRASGAAGQPASASRTLLIRGDAVLVRWVYFCLRLWSRARPVSDKRVSLSPEGELWVRCPWSLCRVRRWDCR